MSFVMRGDGLSEGGLIIGHDCACQVSAISYAGCCQVAFAVYGRKFLDEFLNISEAARVGKAECNGGGFF
jgi:hypothetical protein